MARYRGARKNLGGLSSPKIGAPANSETALALLCQICYSIRRLVRTQAYRIRSGHAGEIDALRRRIDADELERLDVAQTSIPSGGKGTVSISPHMPVDLLFPPTCGIVFVSCSGAGLSVHTAHGRTFTNHCPESSPI